MKPESFPLESLPYVILRSSTHVTYVEFCHSYNNILSGDRYSRTSIIRTPVCHFNVKSVQISEFVRISELSDKICYLAS